MFDWKSLAIQMAVLALGSNPKTRGLAPYVGPAVATTEELLHGHGKEAKLQNGITLVKMAISGANQIRPGTVDESVSDALIAHSVSAVVDATNLVHKNAAAAPTA